MKILFLSFVISLAAANGAVPTVPKVIQELDPTEPWLGQVFHDNNLWVSSNRKWLGADYLLSVYDKDGKAVATTKELRHSMRTIVPIGKNEVLTAGVGPNSVAGFARVKLNGEKLEVSEVLLDEKTGGFISGAIGSYKDQLYFIDIGGLDEGPIVNPGDLKTPRTLWRWNGKSAEYLKSRIHGPVDPVIVGKYLYILESLTVFSGGTNLVRVDLETEETVPLLPSQTYVGLRRLTPLSETLLAFISPEEKKVFFFDTGTNKITRTLSLAQSPIAIAKYGTCLAVSDILNQIHFFGKKDEVLRTWDTRQGLGENLGLLRTLQVPMDTGRLFARTIETCNPILTGGICPEGKNAAISVEDKALETAKLCQSH